MKANIDSLKFPLPDSARDIHFPMPNANVDPRVNEDGTLPMGMHNMPNEQRAMGFEDKSENNMQEQQMIPYPQQDNLMNNPFAAEQYNNVPMPDTPLNIGTSMAEQLLNNDEVPKPFRKKYWWVFHKDNVLTFLDEERKKSKLLNFDIAKIDLLHTIPYYDYTFEEELQLGVIRNIFETKLDRALGVPNNNTKNERIMLQSQFSEQRQISENGMQGNVIKEGFFKRLLGRR